MVERVRLLFLCTGNSCRSQMAESWAKKLHGDWLEAHSAGIAPLRVDPRAVRVMAEEGVDLAGHRSKHLDELGGIEFDHVITVCDGANERCPVFPANVRHTHAGFDDPPRLAGEAATEDEALTHYCRVRDEIRAFVERLPEMLGAADPDRAKTGKRR